MTAVVKGLNEANLPGNSKFVLTELIWEPEAVSSRNIPGNWVKTDNTFSSDATVTENYAQNADVVIYPVEAGYPVADYSSMTSFTVTLSGVVSNTPFSPIELFDNPLLDLQSSLAGQQFTDDEGQRYQTRVQEAYDKLEAWQRRGTILTLQCKYAREGYTDSFGDFRPFVISSFSLARNADTGDALAFTMSLTQIFIARTALVVNRRVFSTKKDEGEKGLKDPGVGNPPKLNTDYETIDSASRDKVRSGQPKMEDYNNAVQQDIERIGTGN